ncbi:MAG: sugar transferase [Pseudanabaenaceae cyanobacterium]
MLLFTVGTEQYPFNALMDWVNLLMTEGIITEEVVVQYGSSTRLPDGVTISKIIPETEFRKLVERATAVIAHCGEGSTLLLEEYDKPYILVPRTAQFHEHVDDHQLEMSEELENQGALIARSPADLAKFLKLINLPNHSANFAEDKALCNYLSKKYTPHQNSQLMLVCSSGGHFKGIQGLHQYWSEFNQRTWVTFRSGTTQTELAGEKAYWAFSPTNRNLPNFWRNLYLAWQVIRRHTPDLVISTGAGVAVPFLLMAKHWCKSKVVFIESKTRVRELSLSAKLLRTLGALDELIVRSSEINHKYPDSTYIPLKHDEQIANSSLEDIRITNFGDTIIISTPSRIFHSEARQLKLDFQELCQEEGNFHKIILDMSRTQMIDSSGVGGLLSCLKILQRASIAAGNTEVTDLVLWSVNPQVLSILQMTNLDHVFYIEPATRNHRPTYQRQTDGKAPAKWKMLCHRFYRFLVEIPVLRALAYLLYFWYPAIELDPRLPVHPSVRSLPKRLIDIVGSLIGLAVTGLLFIPIAILIKLDSSGPVLFQQRRAGLMSKPFGIWKFRSMVANAEALKTKVQNQVSDNLENSNDGQENTGKFFKNSQDPRITKIGKFLRRTSLDEFPQFWNVFTGDMSLIGTRPPTFNEVGLYELENEYTDAKMTEWNRLDVKPGLSGLWQVSGRSNVRSFAEVIEFDLTYKEKWNLRYDLWLIFKTITMLFSRKSGAV